MFGSLREMLDLDYTSSPVSVSPSPAPLCDFALAPLAVEPGAAGRCVRAHSALLPELLACSESRIPGMLEKDW